MRGASLLSCLGALLVLLSSPAATAMGFGRTTTATTLGQRLDFVAHVWLDGDETLAPPCVAADVMIGDRRLGADDVRVAFESAREGRERRVRVSTRSAVDEPVVTVDVTVGCTSQMTRRFVAFVDPPTLRLAGTTENDAVAPQPDVAPIAPAPDVAPAAAPARRSAMAGDEPTHASASRTPRRVVRRAAPERRFDAAPALLPIEPRPALVASLRKPARAGLVGRREASVGARPRLMLEPASAYAAAPAARDASRPAPASVARAPSAATTSLAANPVAAPPVIASSSAVASVAASASAASIAVAPPALGPAGTDAATAPLDGDPARNARIEELEAGLARLRSDSKAQEKTIGVLQARLREAEAARYADGLVYTLAAAMIVFALLAGGFWALRPRQGGRARWFDANATRTRRPAVADAPPSARRTREAAMPAVSQHPSQWRDSGHGILPVTAPATIGGLEVTTVLAPPSHYARTAEARASANAGAADAPHASSLSMGELIDLEQQAEFFVVLGQDEAAIALLANHLIAPGAASPLPFLELLEIHRRRGERDAYEDLREEYQRRFDAAAPEWSPGLEPGQALDAYPQTIARLQALWPTPMHAMETLDALLFRRGEDVEEFDLPAYRDLLFLSSIARELAGHVETGFGAIDLFLPLEGAPMDSSSSRHDSTFAVDLDISGWHDEIEAEATAAPRSAGRRSAG